MLQRDVLAVPGLGDRPSLWAQLFAALGPVRGVDWAPDPTAVGGTPIADLARRTAAAATPSTLVVGHSLGGRAALDAAHVSPPAGLVLIAPALGRPQFERRTVDPAASAGVLSFDVLFAYARELNALTVPVEAPVPTLVVTLDGDDEMHNPTLAAAIAGWGACVAAVPGPHRFWEDDVARAQLPTVVADWAQSIR